MTNPGDTCLTCYGAGEVVSEGGPQSCPDCFGEGRPLSLATQVEWRLRDIERAYRNSGRETEADIVWMIHELRRSREALLKIIARCADADDPTAAVRDVKYEANEALGLYNPS